MTTIADKLQITLDAKNAIKQALVEKNVDLTNVSFANYAQVIENLPTEPTVGTIVNNKINQSEQGWLACDGSVISNTEYPELAALLENFVIESLIPPPPGFSVLPDLDPVVHGNITVTPMIKAE